MEDGRWIVVSHEKYRQIYKKEVRREYLTQAKRASRERERLRREAEEQGSPSPEETAKAFAEAGEPTPTPPSPADADVEKTFSEDPPDPLGDTSWLEEPLS